MAKKLVHSLFYGNPSEDKAKLFAGIKQTAASLTKENHQLVFFCQEKYRAAMIARLSPEIPAENIKTFEECFNELNADPKFTAVVPVLRNILDRMEDIECNVFAAELLNSVISYLYGGYRLNTSILPTDGSKPIDLPAGDKPALVIMSPSTLGPYDDKLHDLLDFWMDYFPAPKHELAESILKLQLVTYNIFNQIRLELPRKICEILTSGDSEQEIKKAIIRIFGESKCQQIYDLIYRQADGSYDIAAAKTMIEPDLGADSYPTSHKLIKIALDIMHANYTALFDLTPNSIDDRMHKRVLEKIKQASQYVKFAQSPIMRQIYACINDAKSTEEFTALLMQRLSLSTEQIKYLTRFVFCKLDDGSLDLAKTKREFNPENNPDMSDLLKSKLDHLISIFGDRLPGHEQANDFSIFGVNKSSFTALPNTVIRTVIANTEAAEFSQLFNHDSISFAIDLIVANLHETSNGKYWTHVIDGQDLNITKVHGLSGWAAKLGIYEDGIERYVFQRPQYPAFDPRSFALFMAGGWGGEGKSGYGFDTRGYACGAAEGFGSAFDPPPAEIPGSAMVVDAAALGSESALVRAAFAWGLKSALESATAAEGSESALAKTLM